MHSARLKHFNPVRTCIRTIVILFSLLCFVLSDTSVKRVDTEISEHLPGSTLEHSKARALPQVCHSRKRLPRGPSGVKPASTCFTTPDSYN